MAAGPDCLELAIGQVIHMMPYLELLNWKAQVSK